MATSGYVPEVRPELLILGTELEKDLLVVGVDNENDNGFVPETFRVAFVASGGLASIGAVGS